MMMMMEIMFDIIYTKQSRIQRFKPYGVMLGIAIVAIEIVIKTNDTPFSDYHYYLLIIRFSIQFSSKKRRIFFH